MTRLLYGAALAGSLVLAGCGPDLAGELTELPIGGELGLATTDGSTFRFADHREDVELLYFGYTTCPDACPTALSRAAAVTRTLRERGGPELADRLLVLLATIDPARDSPDKLAEYLTFFGVNGLGLVGDEEEIAAAARRYGATYERVESGSAAGALFDHTTHMYLIDRRGRVRRLVRSDDPIERVADWVAYLIEEG
ncbi:MAG: SCO family protein [Thermoanaerobaculia bacterium]